MSRRNAMLQFVLIFALFGPRAIYAQSDVTARGTAVWEADAPMAAAATICLPSTAPAIQRQFNPDYSGWDGPREPKIRYLAVTAGDTGQQQTIRVTWDAMPNWPGGHTALIGQKKYLMEPFQVCENSGHGLNTVPPDCGPSPGQPQKWFWGAWLTCAPSQVWYGDLASLSNYCRGSGEACIVDTDCSFGTCGVDGVIHIADEGIVPSKDSPSQPATYTIQVIDETCSLLSEVGYSAPLAIINPIWGDCVSAMGSCPPGPPNMGVSVLGDIVSGLSKFANLYCAPKKTRVDLEPTSTDFRVAWTDVTNGLSGFIGRPYPFPHGGVCAPVTETDTGRDAGGTILPYPQRR